MKKTQLILVLSFLYVVSFGQTVETHLSGDKDFYEGKSYDIVHDLKLLPGFQARAGIEGNFRARYKTYHYPTSNDVVSAGDSVVIVFREAVDINTVPSGISIIGTSSNTVAGHWSQENRNLIFYSDNDFEFGEQVTVTVSEQVHTNDGESAGPMSWQFSIVPLLNSGSIEGDRFICTGDQSGPIISTESASGGTGFYTYQWYRSDDNGVTWLAIGNDSDSFSGMTLSNTNRFKREVTSGNQTATSNSVTISAEVLNPGKLITQTTVCHSEESYVIDDIEGPSGANKNYIYLWYKWSTPHENWEFIDDGRERTYSPGMLSPGQHRYRRSVRATCSSEVFYTNEIGYNVAEELSLGLIEIGAGSGDLNTKDICYSDSPGVLKLLPFGSNSGFDIYGGTSEVSFQWSYSENNIDWIEIEDANSQSYGHSTSLTTTTYFKVVVTDNICGDIKFQIATINVSDELDPGSIGMDQEFCQNYGGSSEINETNASGGSQNPYLYQWQESVNNSGSFSDIPGTNFAAYTLLEFDETKQFMRKVEDPVCHDVAYSNVVEVKIWDQVHAGSARRTATRACYGEDSIYFENLSSPLVYAGSYSKEIADGIIWQKSYDNLTWYNISGADQLDYYSEALIQTTYFRRSISYCNMIDYSTSQEIKVDDLSWPVLTGDQEVCLGDGMSGLYLTNLLGGNPSQPYFIEWLVSENNSDFEVIPNESGTAYYPEEILGDRWYKAEYSNCLRTTFSNKVKVTVNDCSSGARFTNSTKELVEENVNHESYVNLYPNPAQDYFTLDMGGQEYSELKVFDLIGNRLTEPIKLSAGENTIETRDLPAGLVLLRIESENHTETRKLMIER